MRHATGDESRRFDSRTALVDVGLASGSFFLSTRHKAYRHYATLRSQPGRFQIFLYGLQKPLSSGFQDTCANAKAQAAALQIVTESFYPKKTRRQHFLSAVVGCHSALPHQWLAELNHLLH